LSRHHGELARTTLDLRIDATDRLDRLAVHYGWSLVVLVEELAASTERGVEAKLSGKALAKYRAAGYEDDQPVTG
jgi:hypothetical protein